ncbi:hypothetical protein [Erwinia tracheiphila]|uniref:hypothetical protein n=1 Tax=Erwinia tracheiphila TaxID=65700 RepID=UPI00039C295D|nr:hypothetical protein [Erwinia tracheiphila]
MPFCSADHGQRRVIIRTNHHETWHEVVPLTGVSVKTRNALNVTWYDASTMSTAQ